MGGKKGSSILVVEDSRTQSEILCHILEEADFQVTWSPNANDALQKIRTRAFDLILTDIIMPGMDGYSFCNILRNDDDFSRIPVILVTQLSDPKDILKGLSCGARNFIIKPVKHDILLSQVHAVLQESGNQTENRSEWSDLILKYQGDEYTIRSSRMDLLRILLSIYNTALAKHAELEETTDQLNDFTAHLEDMVSERTQALRVTNDIVEHLLMQRSEMVIRIGHDLKTPLTPLFAFLPYLLSMEQDPEKQGILSLLVRNVTTLKQLVDQILKLSQLNASSFSEAISCVDIWMVIHEILESYSYLIHDMHLSVENLVPPGTTLQISAFHASSIFDNLISNAIKYNVNGGSISVSFREEGNYRIISIIDSGQGLTNEESSRVFEDFYKADQSRHDHDSHGLGLSIVRRIVTIYGGMVSVSSEGRGKGSIFQVWFPCPNGSTGTGSQEGRTE